MPRSGQESEERKQAPCPEPTTPPRYEIASQPKRSEDNVTYPYADEDGGSQLRRETTSTPFHTSLGPLPELKVDGLLMDGSSISMVICQSAEPTTSVNDTLVAPNVLLTSGDQHDNYFKSDIHASIKNENDKDTDDAVVSDNGPLEIGPEKQTVVNYGMVLDDPQSAVMAIGSATADLDSLGQGPILLTPVTAGVEEDHTFPTTPTESLEELAPTTDGTFLAAPIESLEQLNSTTATFVINVPTTPTTDAANASALCRPTNLTVMAWDSAVPIPQDNLDECTMENLTATDVCEPMEPSSANSDGTTGF